MGWSFGWDSKKELVDLASQDSFYSAGYKHLKTRVVGNNLWSAIQKPDGEVMISLVKLQCAEGEWGYKAMSDSMGPYEYNCPLSLISMTTTSSSAAATEWRENVREYHRAIKERPAYAGGQTWEFGGEEYKLTEPAGPRRGWICLRVRDNKVFRFAATHLANAKLISA